MSYLVFARKWRPQNFDDVLGQEHVVTTLKNAISSARLAHAYIFAGPRGVGKTSTARILAKSLNCHDGPTLTPCNKCPSCIEITAARSLDVIEIDGASNRGIDDIRALRENVKFSPARGKFKVYIIDEVHQITSEGFNALLKTLEEPPPHVKFIFATTHAQKIPSTISSRCQFLEFRRIPNVRIIQQLKHIAVSEKIKAGEEVFLAIAKASDGSLRDAESMLDELVSFTGGNIRLEDVNSVLGVVEQEYLSQITDKIIKKDAVGILELLDKLIDEGKDPNQLLMSLIEHYRNLMVAKVTSTNQEKLLDMPQEACQAIAAQAKGISLDNILIGFNILLNAQEMARRIDNLRIPLEIALVRLSSEGKTYEQLAAAENSRRLGNAPGSAHQAPVTQRKPEVAAADHHLGKEHKPPAHPISQGHLPQEAVPRGSSDIPRLKGQDIDLEKVKGLWTQFLEKLGRVKVSAAHYLEEGSPVKAAGAVLTIGFPDKASFHKESLERKENHLLLEKIWNELLGQDIRINFNITKGEEPHKEAVPVQEHDPLLKSALDTFNGRVVRKG